jgi:hypothetical protein
MVDVIYCWRVLYKVATLSTAFLPFPPVMMFDIVFGEGIMSFCATVLSFPVFSSSSNNFYVTSVAIPFSSPPAIKCGVLLLWISSLHLLLKISRDFPVYSLCLDPKWLWGLHNLISQSFITQNTVRAGIFVVHPENRHFQVVTVDLLSLWCVCARVCVSPANTDIGTGITQLTSTTCSSSYSPPFLSTCYASLHWPVSTHWECDGWVYCPSNAPILYLLLLYI